MAKRQRAKKAPAKKKLTPNQQAFEKQRKRISRFVKAAEKRGYKFPENTVPERPKRVTKKDISRVTAIKPEQLYAKATYTYQTGEVISGTERRYQERQLAALKGKFTRIENQAETPDDPRFHTTAGHPPAEATDVADRIKETLERFNQGKSSYEKIMEEANSWRPEVTWNAWFAEQRRKQVEQMKRMINASIQNYGFPATMRAIGASAVAFSYAAEVIMFDSKQEAIQEAFVVLAQILKGSALSADEGADLDILSDAVIGYQDEGIEV